MKLTNIKEWYSTSIGALLVLFAITGYYFHWPKEAPDSHHLMACFGGFILIFTNPRKTFIKVRDKLTAKL